jgi:hypothetical protein
MVPLIIMRSFTEFSARSGVYGIFAFVIHEP